MILFCTQTVADWLPWTSIFLVFFEKIWNLFSNAKIYSDPGYWLVSIWLFEVHHCWSTSALFPLILYHTLTAKLTVRAFLLCKSKNNDRSKVIQGWKKHNNLSCTYPIYSPFGFVMVNFYFMNFLFSPEILEKFNSIFYRSDNLPFSKSASKNFQFLCEREVFCISVTFSTIFKLWLYHGMQSKILSQQPFGI